MPKRTDIHKILLIGSGPIVIGQACGLTILERKHAESCVKKAMRLS